MRNPGGDIHLHTLAVRKHTLSTIALPPPLNLGHEGAGEVIERGEGMTSVAVGDYVVSFFKR